MGGDMYGGGDLLLRAMSAPTEAEIKQKIILRAVGAMEELMRMARTGEPLWITNPDADGNTTMLNEDEYIRTLTRLAPFTDGFKCEASRDTAIVVMDAINLVQILMDVDRWLTVFSGIVSRATILEVLSTGVEGNYNGAMQVMMAEFQVPSPLVPTRESYYVRYCKQLADKTWCVVDVSLDNLCPNLPPRSCQRRPSGCLIQEMPTRYSKVTWVEHVEVEIRSVHSLFKLLISSGHAFGAKRWVATLDRQCQRLVSAMASNISNVDVDVITNEGKKSMKKLAERMVISFYRGVSASTIHTWTRLSGGVTDDVRVMTRRIVDESGRPNPGIVLSAATSFWLPQSPKTVFEFLRNDKFRNEWDILCNGGIVQEMAHIATGRDKGNCVSLLRVGNSGKMSNMLILQESCTDAISSFVIYAPVDMVSMRVVLNVGHRDFVALLPSGFGILPNGGSSGSSLLTVVFQILIDKISLVSVATVNNLLGGTVQRIEAALSSCDIINLHDSI